MARRIRLALFYVLLLAAPCVKAQMEMTQSIKGMVVDADSRNGIPGATVSLSASSQSVQTDSTGEFRLAAVPLGRQAVVVTRVGYESKTVPGVVVTSGKEVYLAIALTEKVQALSDIRVVAHRNTGRARNEFATVSARSFSVEETKRYAASAYDPARMAKNFAGVSDNGDGNDIVVRGNSPKGVLWRLECIEIPNPNHFGEMGNSGGPVSMLSSSTLGTSDFYTGAFPAEIGAATSGVFDLNLRRGNHDKREYAFMVGGLGIEAAAEGPFRNGSGASYLVNYRYSTLSLLKGFLANMAGILPEYQDLSFNIYVPTKRTGTFTLFGLGGINLVTKDGVKDSARWTDDEPNFVLSGKGKTGVLGLSHQYFINDHSFLKTIVAATGVAFNERVDTLDAANHYAVAQLARTRTEDLAYRASVVYNNKLTARHTIRSGVIASYLSYDYRNRYFDRVDDRWRESLKGNGSTFYYQAYLQWKYRLTNAWTLNAGTHASFFALNHTSTLEPRIALTYSTGGQVLTLAGGLHAKPEHLSTYLIEPDYNTTGRAQPNMDLQIPKALHFVLGYERPLGGGWRLKGEAYYQHLYDVPVEEKEGSYFSMLNASSIEDLDHLQQLVSGGKGRNYGVDLTLEKSFSRNYYVMLVGSVFHSTYTNYSGQEYNTRFNRECQSNLVAGKEWKTGRTGRNVIGLNGKLVASGGLKESPIDVEASRRAGRVQYIPGQYYTSSEGVYYRLDAGFSYKVNRRHTTHSFSFDVQNLTNHQNLYLSWYNPDKGTVKKIYQMGFFPVVNYRIEF